MIVFFYVFFLYIFCLVYVTQIFDMFYILWAMAPCSWIDEQNKHYYYYKSSEFYKS